MFSARGRAERPEVISGDHSIVGYDLDAHRCRKYRDGSQNRYAEGIMGMLDPNNMPAEDFDRISAIADLIHDEIGDRLHHDADLAGELDNVEIPEVDKVRFTFTDGRNVTVRVEIDPVT
jgi:hypothetical protein